MNDHNALILAIPNAADRYELVFVDGESRKHRTLGTVPFTAAELKQVKRTDGTWAFLLTGTVGATKP